MIVNRVDNAPSESVSEDVTKRPSLPHSVMTAEKYMCELKANRA